MTSQWHELRGFLATKNTWVFLALTALAVTLFWGGLKNVFWRWGAQPEYSHGYLIPLVSLYILWEKRQHILAYAGAGSWWGLVICSIAIIFLLAGEISALYLVIHYAFLMFLMGLSILVIGKGTKHTWVPIAILGFAIPLPYIIEVVLTANMQLISSSLGVAFIRLFNIPVYLSGNVIDLGEFKLHVVEACSGLRYLFPLACIGFVAAYFYQAALWKRGIIFLSTIPITIVMNSVRIGATGLLVENYGNEIAQGFLHDFEGWVVFVICIAILLVEITILEKITTNRRLGEVFLMPVSEPEAFTGEKSKNLWAQVSLLVVLVASIVFIQTLDKREEAVVGNTSLATFPMNIGPWRGYRDVLAQDVVDALKISDYLIADYQNEQIEGAQVNFYVAYYDNQRKGVSPHSPKVCIPGGGWEIAEFKRMRLEGFPVNRVLIRKGSVEQLVYYWFIERGEVVANEYVKKWMLLRDALKSNRTDGSLVRVVTPLLANEDIEAAEKRMASFMAQANPQLLRYLPAKPN